MSDSLNEIDYSNHYEFSGKVIPERAMVTLQDYSFFFTHHNPAGPVERVLMTISIRSSRVHISCKCGDPIYDIAGFRHALTRSVLFLLNAKGFVDQAPYDFDMETMKDLQSGKSIVFDQLPPADLPAISDLSVQDFVNAGWMEFGAFIGPMLSDYSHAMKSPYDSAFHCYRAVETISQYFQNTLHVSRKMAWSLVYASTAGLSKLDVDRLKKIADEPRHGKPHYITEGDRNFVLEVASKAIVGFIMHLQHGAVRPSLTD